MSVEPATTGFLPAINLFLFAWFLENWMYTLMINECGFVQTTCPLFCLLGWGVVIRVIWPSVTTGLCGIIYFCFLDVLYGTIFSPYNINLLVLESRTMTKYGREFLGVGGGKMMRFWDWVGLRWGALQNCSYSQDQICWHASLFIHMLVHPN